MRRRIFAVLLIVTAVSTILVVVPSQPAFADDCQTEHAIFWGDYSTTDWKWDTHGTRDSIRLSNRSLDGLCPTNIDLAWSTTHMTLNNVPYEQIELGWAEQSIGSGETAYYWFTEWQQGNSFPHRVEKLFNSSTGACNPTLGGYVLMKVNNYPLGTTNWRRHHGRKRRPSESAVEGC